MQYKILEKYLQFELHTLESQDFSVQASQRLVYKKTTFREAISSSRTRSEKRNTSYNTLKKIY